MVTNRPVIDLDADPFIPDGWDVWVQHIGDGQLEWNPYAVELYLSPNQQGEKMIEGWVLREELRGRPVFNANLLDYLLANPQLIPENWKGWQVFFWGTTYRHPYGGLCIRSLYSLGNRWFWDHDWLESGWRGNYLAAVRLYPDEIRSKGGVIYP